MFKNKNYAPIFRITPNSFESRDKDGETYIGERWQLQECLDYSKEGMPYWRAMANYTSLKDARFALDFMEKQGK